MSISLTILGCHSATPRTFAHPTSQYLEINNRRFLIDCGEGTQVQLRKYKIKFSAINHIFISHLHGDHFFGLTPLLSSLHLLGRNKEIHIYGPHGLKDIINLQMKAQGSWLSYPLIFHELDFTKKSQLYEDDKIIVHSFPVKHRIACCGFLFEEKALPRNIIGEKIKELSIPFLDIKGIKNGNDWEDENGKTHNNHSLTTKAPESLSYAFCTDTLPLENLQDYVYNPSLLYHEATFTNKHKDRAKQTHHSTAEQAANIAKGIKAGNLILGHFSTRYLDYSDFLLESKPIFPKVYLAKDGTKYCIKHQNPKSLEIE